MVIYLLVYSLPSVLWLAADCPLVDKRFNVNTLTMVKTFSPVSLFLSFYKPLQMQILIYWQIVNKFIYCLACKFFHCLFCRFCARYFATHLHPSDTVTMLSLNVLAEEWSPRAEWLLPNVNHCRCKCTDTYYSGASVSMLFLSLQSVHRSVEVWTCCIKLGTL